MNWWVKGFEFASVVTLVALIAYFVTRSVRGRRLHPGIYLTLGIVSISWLEAPFDRAMYVQFHPDMIRLPAIGPLAAAQGGLPAIAPFAYVMYYLLPALVAIAIADAITRRRGSAWPQTLVWVAVTVGIVFDLAMQLGPARLVPMWVFSRTAPYITAFPGTPGQIPLYEPIAMALMITWSACLLRWRDDNGDNFIERMAARLSGGRHRVAVTAVCYIAVFHALYLYIVAPFLMLWAGRMLTVTGSIEPFPGKIAAQPADPQSHGALGAVLVVAWLLAGVLITYLIARRSPTVAHRAIALGGAPRPPRLVLEAEEQNTKPITS